MADPVVTPPLFARPSQFRDFLGVSAYLRDLHRTLTLGLSRFADALNTGVAQYGTWTPGVTASGTAGTPAYSIQVGLYTLRGADVWISGHLRLSGWTGSPSGNVTVTGLPFLSIGTTDTEQVLTTEVVRGVNLSAGYSWATLITVPGTATLDFMEMGDNVTEARVQASAVGASTLVLRFTGVYRTALT